MFESNHGQVVTYRLSEAERQAIIAKYGPPIAKHGDIKFTNILRARHKPEEHKPKITLDRYLEMKEEGMPDRDICRAIHMREHTLFDLKRIWGIPRGKYSEWKEKVKV